MTLLRDISLRWVRYDHFILPQKFSSVYYFFVYYYGENNVFGLIQPTPYSADKLEVDISDEDLVDNMGDYMLEATERKNGKICDDSDSICVEEHEMDDDNYSLSDALEQNTIYNIYIYGHMNQPI